MVVVALVLLRNAGVVSAATLTLAACREADEPTAQLEAAPQRKIAQAAVRPASSKGALAGMRLIPSGEFTMGTDDPISMPNERPAHRVRLDAFWIDEHDVTNEEFRKFVEVTGYVTTAERPPEWRELAAQLPPGTPKPPPETLIAGSLVFTAPDHRVPLDDMAAWWKWVPGASWKHPEGPQSNLDGRGRHPVVQISWDDATAYAKWVGKRLPTEAEWEYAARGGKEKARYVWGDERYPDGRPQANTFQGEFPNRNTTEDGYVGTSPVESFPPNGYGLYDMAGNVWQWTSDWYRADANVARASEGVCHNPSGPTQSFDPLDPSAKKRVIKGGSFLCSPEYCESFRPSARRGTPPDTGSTHVGFRCARSASEP